MMALQRLFLFCSLTFTTVGFGIVQGHYSTRHRLGQPDLPGRYPARLFSFWVAGQIDGKNRGGQIVLSGVQVCPKLVLTAGHWFERSIAAARYGGTIGLWASDLTEGTLAFGAMNPYGALGAERTHESFKLKPSMTIHPDLQRHWVVLNGDGTGHPDWRVAGVALERYLQQQTGIISNEDRKKFPLIKQKDYANVAKIQTHPLYNGLGKGAKSVESYNDLSALFLSESLPMDYWVTLPKTVYEGKQTAFISGLGLGSIWKTTTKRIPPYWQTRYVWNAGQGRKVPIQVPVFLHHTQRLEKFYLAPGKHDYAKTFRFDAPQWMHGELKQNDGALFYMRRFGEISKGHGWGFGPTFREPTHNVQCSVLGGRYHYQYHQRLKRNVAIPILESVPGNIHAGEPYPYPSQGDSGGPFYTKHEDKKLGIVYTLYGTHSLQDIKKHDNNVTNLVKSSFTPLHDTFNRELVLSWMRDPASGCTAQQIQVADRQTLSKPQIR